MKSNQLRFDCPPQLAQHFWILCRIRHQTPGAALRALMEKEILDHPVDINDMDVGQFERMKDVNSA